MKKFLIVLLSLTLVFALPINEVEDSLEDDVPEDGWFVPQKDGSLKWMTEEEAQIQARAQLMSRKKSKEAKVEFYLYTAEFPNEGHQIYIGDSANLKMSSFNSENPTRIIIHGWQNNYKSDVNTEIREALFSMGEYNVISVDWSDKADRYNYVSAAGAVSEIGQRVAHLIEFLRDEGNVKNEDLIVIGHSLGAHVAGFAGKTIEGEQIHTIIGLDTAFPLFKYDKCDERLCSTDAMYVESIHTNGKLLGFIQPIGQVAFYPNGGKTQPGCGLDMSGTCSHSRAYIYYAESIRQNFLGLKCDDWKTAVKKNCLAGGQGTMAGFSHAYNYMKLDGTFYSPVDKKSPYSLLTKYNT
ncbi:phospholipase A1 VesT1.02-like [Episyrphus balteatus]|uniref:phospholipase A1 VesT1.02-like n=1 Tax=Episyrphus balteatus TaxID=286459 RepID=UPI002484EB7A|nr:phospholipase A1 VesT1.02-like [Episyrphus balteatus]